MNVNGKVVGLFTVCFFALSVDAFNWQEWDGVDQGATFVGYNSHSLAVDSRGLPAISYRTTSDLSNQSDLRLWRWDGGAQETYSPAGTFNAPSLQTGFETSLAFNPSNGQFGVLFVGQNRDVGGSTTNDVLKLAEFDGETWAVSDLGVNAPYSNAAVTDLTDINGNSYDRYMHPTLAYGANGNAHIVYGSSFVTNNVTGSGASLSTNNFFRSTLTYAEWDGSSLSTNSVSTVANLPGSDLEIAMLGDTPIIGYSTGGETVVQEWNGSSFTAITNDFGGSGFFDTSVGLAINPTTNELAATYFDRSSTSLVYQTFDTASGTWSNRANMVIAEGRVGDVDLAFNADGTTFVVYTDFGSPSLGDEAIQIAYLDQDDNSWYTAGLSPSFGNTLDITNNAFGNSNEIAIDSQGVPLFVSGEYDQIFPNASGFFFVANNAIPEPSVGALVALGGLLLFRLRKHGLI